MIQQNDKNINNVRLSYNSMGAPSKLRNNTSQNMGASKMPSALDNSFNQNLVGAVHSIGPSEEDQFMSGHGVINQPGFNNIAQTAKVMVSSKAKRVTAATREIQSGTNARVNTFDNRGLQAQQNHQYE